MKAYAMLMIALFHPSTTVTAVSKYAQQRRIVMTDDAFVNRHEKDPVDQDAIEGNGILFVPSHEPSTAISSGPSKTPSTAISSEPSNAPSNSTTNTPSIAPSASATECTPIEGGYGSETSLQVDLTYTYEVEVEADSLNKMDSEIIPAVEDAILKSLHTLFFTGCSQRRNLYIDNSSEIKSSRQRPSRKIRRRQLGVQGLFSSPNDEHIMDMMCVSESLSSETCAVVRGGMSFYLSEETLSIDAETAGGQALALIKKNMNSGLYNDSHDEIISISFVEDSVFGEGTFVTTNIISGAQESNNGGRSYGTIAVASCAILAFVGLAAALGRRKEKRKDDDDDKENQNSSRGSSDDSISHESSNNSSLVSSYDVTYNSTIGSTSAVFDK